MIKYLLEGIKLYFCSQPFEKIEIYENGDVYNCCPSFIKFFSIGNIFKTSFDEIWNGEKVKELRLKLLNSDFSFCDDTCNLKNKNNIDKSVYKEVSDKYPSSISVSSDNFCNIKCKICRDVQYKTNFNLKTLEKEIDEIWLPIFKDAKILRFGCSGEPFASSKETMLIKKSAQNYPNLKFHFHTNGILADEKKLKELNVFDKIDTITLSLHSASRWTYNKVVSGGNWDKVMKNIKLYSKMKNEGLINQFRMIFVVYSENYKDMEKFARMAEKYNAQAEFWALRLVPNTKIGADFDKYSIVNKNHKDFKNLVKMLNKPVFKNKNVILYPELKAVIS